MSSLVIMNTTFCKELFDDFGNVTRNLKEANAGVELHEAYLVMLIFGVIVLIFSYGYVFIRKKFHHDQVNDLLVY